MKTHVNAITHEKETGRVYTPEHIVRTILDLSGYRGQAVRRRHAIDNSCGDGAFLTEMVRRYCAAAAGTPEDELRAELETYIHGIEIDAVEHGKCVDRLDAAAAACGVTGVAWDIVCGDTLSIRHYDGRMDFVLGNPPYVRVHNLAQPLRTVKKHTFAQDGMTDLFIVFYEIGIRMLSEHGVLGYITPSSFFNSVAGAKLRRALSEGKLLKTLVDLKHYQAFPSTTYTAIAVLEKGRGTDAVGYCTFNAKTLAPEHVDTLSAAEYCIGGNFYFARRGELETLRRILTNRGRCGVAVKNGYATLCDPVFVGDFDFTSPHVIPAVKASKGVTRQIIYPYDEQGRLLPEDELRKDAAVYTYLLSHRDRLTRRSHEKDGGQFWYAFGRSQAILDTCRPKMALSTLMRDERDLKLTPAPAGVGVYGGLYMTSDTVPLEELAAALRTPEFAAYAALLAKYKSGGYYTFSSRDVKAYLDYKFACEEDAHADKR